MALAREPMRGQLRVVKGPLLAGCLLVRIVAVHAGVARLPVGERLFMLAHERGHWSAVGRFFRRHTPDVVTPEHTGPVAQALGHCMATLSQRRELDAHSSGLALPRTAGHDGTDAMRFCLRGGLRRGAVRPRTAALCSAWPRWWGPRCRRRQRAGCS